MEPGTAVVVLLGAGAGRRLDAREPKAFLRIGDRPILAVAAAAAIDSPSVRGLIVAAPPGWGERARTCLAALGTAAEVITGGDSRQASVRSAIATIPGDLGVVVVHDAARPFASPKLFARVIDEVALGADGAIPVVAINDTLLRIRGEVVAGAERREDLVLAQTPQAFRTSVLREAHAKAEAAGRSFTDDASLLSWAGSEVRAVPGDPGNVKITTAEDLALADRRMRGDG
jgi:2-C-methyl-D-erythritol 4-phosphate cytidylyltransferase/2-C-methyl-D-erythritol 2,4-cyclodiphosphate synthase